MQRLDTGALLKGTAVAVAAAMPLAALSSVVDDDTLAGIVLLGVFLAFAAGGFVAARAASDFPYSTGGAAGLAGFVVVQVVVAVVRLIAGHGVPLAPIAFFAFASYGSGLTGAVAGLGRRGRAHE